MQPGATLSLQDMNRNGLLDVDAVYKVVYSGKGKMYGFGEGCTPKVCLVGRFLLRFWFHFFLFGYRTCMLALRRVPYLFAV